MSDTPQEKTGQQQEFEHLSVADTVKTLDTDPGTGLSQEEADRRRETYGDNALHERKESGLARLFSYFWGPIPWMIELAAIMAVLVQDWADCAIIVVLLVFNAAIGFFEEHKAENALEALKNQLALKARALRDGQWREVDAQALVPGDIVRLRLGDVVPADVKLSDGDYLSVDQAALTGESLPVSKRPGDVAFSGSIVKQGEMVAVVTSTGEHTYFGRTAKLVESAGGGSHFQKAVMRIGDFLILVAGVLAAVLVGVELHRDTSILRLAEFVLILLVASIPVAMPAVLSVTMALGAQALARMKAIVSKLQSIEEMAGIDILCSDKTGTLTQNRLTMGDPLPIDGVDAQDLLLAAALASKPENGDPIDLAVIAGLSDQRALNEQEQVRFQPFDPVSKRTEATIRNAAGTAFLVTKGAPQVILDLCQLDEAARRTADDAVLELAEKGFRTLGVARAETEGAWRYLGILPLYDPPRDDSKQTIEDAGDHGIEVKMVTGDNIAIASETARQLGMGAHIQLAEPLFRDGTPDKVSLEAAACIERADGFAQVFPEHKYGIVKALQERGHLVGMTGDGVNDAPALKQADVGIAVSGATEAARAAADLVLTEPGLSVIVRAVDEARRIFERMMSYTIYRVAMTIDIMVFVVLASIVFNFFPLTPIMIIALALLDDVPIMTIAFDNARLSPTPVRWNMRRVLMVSAGLGVVLVAESYGLLLIGLNLFALPTPQLQTMIFLQLVAGGHLLLFLTRTRRAFWSPPLPSWPLFLAIVGTQILAVLMTGFGWLVPSLPWAVIGFVWCYNIVWMVAQDVFKLGLYWLLEDRGIRKGAFLRHLNRELDHHGGIHRHFWRRA